MRAPPLLLSFLKFGGLSGLGWIADACILLTLVGVFGVAPFAANIVSSCIAALSVFLISRELIFDKASGRATLRIAAYLGYVLIAIVIASWAVQWLVGWMRAMADAHGVAITATVIAGIAKVLVTPPQLALNFLMSRFMSERKIGNRDAVTG